MNSFGILLVCIQACLVYTVSSQCIAGYGPGIIGPSIAPGFIGPNVPGLSPYAAPGYGIPGIPGPGYGGYGGSGAGDVAVVGELPVVGTTAVTGRVPIIGNVQYSGPLAAAGAVTISGFCSCGCPY